MWAVIILLLALPLALSVPSAVAAGDVIEVISNERELRLPGEVVLSLEVEGKADIVEVRLYYKESSLDIWWYTYPALSPSHRVRTSFNLPLSGGSYLPPGTELEYYYSIRDSQGNTLTTRPETFIYIGDRFRWETVSAGPLTLYWHDLSESRVRDVARQVEQSLHEIGNILEVNLDQNMTGIIYNTRSEALESFPNQGETIREEQVFQGFAFPERGFFVGVGLGPRLIVHESAHLLLHQATNSPWARVPAWVGEGFASYVEGGAGQRAGRLTLGGSPGLIPLRHMSSIPGKPEDIRYFYRKSESVVGYLLETHGAANFREFVGRLNEGRNADSALQAVYGFDLDGLERRWSSPQGQQEDERPRGGGSVFPYLDGFLFGLLALLVLGVAVAAFVRKMLRDRAKRLEDGDGITDEEWEGRP